MAAITALVSQLEEVEDAEEETFLLYSQPIPSQNLGFIDPKASQVQVEVAGRDFVIHQSPTVLSSNRAGGTTGAVLWKITPVFAEWLSSPSNILFSSPSPILSSSSAVLELGCGISPLTGLCVAPRIGRYVLTDQPYVQRLLQKNLDANSNNNSNSNSSNSGARSSRKRVVAKDRSSSSSSSKSPSSSSSSAATFTTLDWETDQVTPALTGVESIRSFDAVIACDCVYNYALAQPLVQTCVDACRLREQQQEDDEDNRQPCVCIIAQQLRNDQVFQGWLELFHAAFRVWRVPDDMLPEQLRSVAGFVVHVGVLRETRR